MELLEQPYYYAYGYMSNRKTISQQIVIDKYTYNAISNKYVYDGYIYDTNIGDEIRYSLPVGIFEIPAALKSREVDAIYRILRIFCTTDNGRYYTARVRIP